MIRKQIKLNNNIIIIEVDPPRTTITIKNVNDEIYFYYKFVSKGRYEIFRKEKVLMALSNIIDVSNINILLDEFEKKVFETYKNALEWKSYDCFNEEYERIDEYFYRLRAESKKYPGGIWEIEQWRRNPLHSPIYLLTLTINGKTTKFSETMNYLEHVKEFAQEKEKE